MKKINITTIALLAYLIVMSVIGWPGNNPGNSYTEYFLIIGTIARHHHPFYAICKSNV